MKNWKMFGLWFNGITIIPCYYDLIRYRKLIYKYLIRKLNIINLTMVILRFRALFDTSIKI